VSRREAFLARVRAEVLAARGSAGAEAAHGTGEAAASVRDASPGAGPHREALVARFRDEAERVAVGVHRVGTVGEAADRIRELARARGVSRVVTWGPETQEPLRAVIERLGAGGFATIEAIPCAPSPDDRTRVREAAASADMGLTGADLAIAETGTLVLASGPGRSRLVSLLPPWHVAVVAASRIVAGLAEAGAVVASWWGGEPARAGANVVFVTGPSRTADIELTLTRGVHGPREVDAVVIDGI
jgi:L-lactate dehydrogenase complex protein LldG